MDDHGDAIDWMTAWHEAQVSSPAKHATCRLCGARADRAIHSESYARSRGYEFVRPPKGGP